MANEAKKEVKKDTKESIEDEISKMKRHIEQLKRDQKVFMTTFKMMKPRDRAMTVRKILGDQNVLANFIAKASRTNLGTTALKFSMENIKLSYQSLMTLWHKTERMLDSMTGTGLSGLGGLTGIRDPQSETSRVIEEYALKLKSIGQQPSPEVLEKFKEKIEKSLEVAKEQYKGKEFSIQVVEKDGKIKVRFEPK